jgi:hypothetical protein
MIHPERMKRRSKGDQTRDQDGDHQDGYGIKLLDL